MTGLCNTGLKRVKFVLKVKDQVLLKIRQSNTNTKIQNIKLKINNHM